MRLCPQNWNIACRKTHSGIAFISGREQQSICRLANVPSNLGRPPTPCETIAVYPNQHMANYSRILCGFPPKGPLRLTSVGNCQLKATNEKKGALSSQP